MFVCVLYVCVSLFGEFGLLASSELPSVFRTVGQQHHTGDGHRVSYANSTNGISIASMSVGFKSLPEMLAVAHLTWACWAAAISPWSQHPFGGRHYGRTDVGSVAYRKHCLSCERPRKDVRLAFMHVLWGSSKSLTEVRSESVTMLPIQPFGEIFALSSIKHHEPKLKDASQDQVPFDEKKSRQNPKYRPI